QQYRRASRLQECDAAGHFQCPAFHLYREPVLPEQFWYGRRIEPPFTTIGPNEPLAYGESSTTRAGRAGKSAPGLGTTEYLATQLGRNRRHCAQPQPGATGVSRGAAQHYRAQCTGLADAASWQGAERRYQ